MTNIKQFVILLTVLVVFCLAAAFPIVIGLTILVLILYCVWMVAGVLIGNEPGLGAKRYMGVMGGGYWINTADIQFPKRDVSTNEHDKT